MPISGPPLEAPTPLHRILEVGLARQPDAEALVSRRNRWTWRQLDEISSRLARGYLGLGLQPGDRVASLMPNRTELILHYLACLKSGLVAMPLNYRYMAPEIDHALGVGGARILLAHDERAADLAESKLVPQLPLGQISFGDNGGSGELTIDSLAAGEADTGDDVRELVPPKPEDPAIIFFTSGSTGKPKGVCHSFGSLGWIVASSARSFGIQPDDVMLPGGSASHVGANHMTMMTLAVGGKVLMTRTFDGDEILPLLREERPTKVWMLPSALYALTRDHGARREDFASIKACFSGGDKVSDALEDEFTNVAGFPIDECYGMTETGTLTVNTPEAHEIGSVGPLSPGYEASVRDDDGREVPVGAEGRLWVRFAGNMVGYWENPEATAATIVDGWLDTGDVMSVDEQGFLWFHGRKKQIIVHDGSNICPQEVEGALLEHSAVSNAGVVGVRSPLHGENVRAYITLAEGATPPTMQELIEFARKRVGYKAPEEILILEEMPLNATGKVDRMTLKKMAAGKTE